jgi:hypothetical protein
MSKKVLDAMATRLEKNLKKQVQKNLAEVFDYASCKAVAREIRAGRNVTGNAEWGIRFCIHSKTSPRVDPKTLEFTPQPEKAKKLDEKFIKLTNDMLESGGFPKMDPNLLSRMRRQDKEFERDIAKRRKERNL